MLMWSRSRALAFGILLGLATAAKLYPAFLLGPLLLLCWRAGKWREFFQALGGAVGAWLAVNLPVMITHDTTGFHIREGWAKFYTFSKERGVDFGSFWLIWAQNSSHPPTIDFVNTAASVLVVLCFLGIGALTFTAPRRPRFAQLAFLMVAAFVLTNKVYSPQYVLWLVPLAVLARPKWRDFIIWQACEVAYFLGIWMYLAYTTSGDAHKGLRRTATSGRSCCTWRARCTCAPSSYGTSSCRSGTWCAGPATTTPQAECWTARRTSSCSARRPTRPGTPSTSTSTVLKWTGASPSCSPTRTVRPERTPL